MINYLQHRELSPSVQLNPLDKLLAKGIANDRLSLKNLQDCLKAVKNSPVKLPRSLINTYKSDLTPILERQGSNILTKKLNYLNSIYAHAFTPLTGDDISHPVVDKEKHVHIPLGSSHIMDLSASNSRAASENATDKKNIMSRLMSVSSNDFSDWNTCSSKSKGFDEHVYSTIDKNNYAWVYGADVALDEPIYSEVYEPAGDSMMQFIDENKQKASAQLLDPGKSSSAEENKFDDEVKKGFECLSVVEENLSDLISSGFHLRSDECNDVLASVKEVVRRQRELLVFAKESKTDAPDNIESKANILKPDAKQFEVSQRMDRVADKVNEIIKTLALSDETGNEPVIKNNMDDLVTMRNYLDFALDATNQALALLKDRV